MDIKPLAGLTITLRVLLKINIAITFIAVLAGLFNYHTFSNLPSDVNPSLTLLPSDVVTIFVALVQIILALVVGVTFLCWIYRTNKNLSARSGEQMTFTPGWSVGWYFIPFANLVQPYQVMKEIWQVSHKDRAVSLSVVGWWWALWLVSNFLGQLTFRLSMWADDAAGFAMSAMASVLSEGVGIAQGVVALTLVTRIGIAYSNNIIEDRQFVQAEVIASPRGQ